MFPIVLGFSVYLTVDAVDEAINAPVGSRPFSPAVVATCAATTALIGMDIGLNAAKRRFERSLSFETLPSSSAATPESPYLPFALYRRALILALQSGPGEGAGGAVRHRPGNRSDPRLSVALSTLLPC